MRLPINMRPVLLVAVALTLALGCADRLVLPPVPKAAPHDGSPRRAIRNGAHVLEAFVARSPGAMAAEPRAFVLRFTGDAGGAAKFTASRWGERPVEVWVVNYPGYGGSTGPRTLRGLADAALVAYDELRRVAGDRPIFVEGFSLGTVPALRVAAERKLAGVVLQNPPPLRELILRHHGWWNAWLVAGPVAMQVPRELDSVANARRSTCPGVFLVAERDRTIPAKTQRLVVDAFKGPRRMIVQKGADHADSLTAAEAAELQTAMDWLWMQAGLSDRPTTTRPAD
jgi:uncharacterized protein